MSNKQIINFESDFLSNYLRNGFGVLPKREIDILVLHLMMKYGLIEGKNNYEKCKYLKITPTKLKNLIIEVGLKYEKSNIKDTLLIIAKDIQNKKIILEYHPVEVKLSFCLENPVLQFELEQAVKQKGRSLEKPNLNEEIIKIDAGIFIELMFDAFPNKKKPIVDIFRKQIKDKNKIDSLAKRSLPISTQIKNFAKDGINMLSVASSITSIIGGK